MAQEILNHMGPDRRFWIVISFVTLIALTEIAGQTCLKMARVKNKTYLLTLGILLYAMVAYLLYMCYQYEGLGHTNLVWSCITIVLALFVGYHWFKEPFNKYNWIAVVLAFGAIYAAHRGDEEN